MVAGFLLARELECWNVVFLAAAIATSLTGFLFPFHGFVPAYTIGIASLIVLAIAVIARHFNLAGGWRETYAVTATMALYFNMVVLVAQLFRKVGALRALAPTETELPFELAQIALLVLFIGLAVGAVYGFNREAEEVLKPERSLP